MKLLYILLAEFSESIIEFQGRSDLYFRAILMHGSVYYVYVYIWNVNERFIFI